MRRSSLAYLLILLVGICPYFCMGEASKGADSEASRSHCCCKGRPADGDNESPHAPCRDEPDCLCKGAIVDGVNAEVTEYDTDLLITDLLDFSADFVRTQPSADLFLGVCHFPPLSTGRDVCALTCALLL